MGQQKKKKNKCGTYHKTCFQIRKWVLKRVVFHANFPALKMQCYEKNFLRNQNPNIEFYIVLKISNGDPYGAFVMKEFYDREENYSNFLYMQNIFFTEKEDMYTNFSQYKES